MEQIFEYPIYEQTLPYKASPTFSPDRNGEIWRPLNCTHYIKPEVPYSERRYLYDTAGVLKQENGQLYGNTWDRAVTVYNQTFTKEGLDFEDTITYYKKKGNSVIPEQRWYLDYHYYDVMPEDSFYYVQYHEIWNEASNEWRPYHRRYQGHFDTTLFIIREIREAYFIGGEWFNYSGVRIWREYNEKGLVTTHIYDDLNSETGKYETYRKHEYFYDEEDVVNEMHNYIYLGNGSWKLTYKVIDIQYIEWYPNCQSGIGIIVIGGPEYLPISGNRAKMKSYFVTYVNDNDEWETLVKSNHEWDINETKSHIKSTFHFFNEDWRLYFIEGDIYDERGDYIQDSHERFLLSTGLLEIGYKDCYIHSYHPNYDYLESRYAYNLSLLTD
jgi:hypothetical protein